MVQNGAFGRNTDPDSFHANADVRIAVNASYYDTVEMRGNHQHIHYSIIPFINVLDI